MKNKGITLISLVITIIVLLILAGVTISSLNGDNAIIKKAGEAKEKVEIETEKEILGTTYIEASKRFKKGKIEKTIFEAKLENNKGNKNTNVIENGETIVVKFTDTNRYYEIDNKGNIEGPKEFIKDEFAGDITKGGTLDGSETKPYEINCIEDLVTFSIMTNGGNKELGISQMDFNDKKVVLTKTLDFEDIFSYKNYKETKYGDLNTNGIVEDIKTELTNKEEGCIGFTPISVKSLFINGTFDGNNYEIRNLYQNKKKNINGNDLALFIYAKEIKNLTVTGEIINNDWHAAGICSNGPAKIYNCKNYANITGHNMVGGIVAYGQNEGNITKCVNYGNIKITGYSYGYAGCGGIVGTINIAQDKTFIVKDTINKGNIITSKKLEHVGGITGCISYLGTVKLDKNINYGIAEGGILGKEQQSGDTTISNCINYGESKNGLVNNYEGASWTSELNLNIQNCFNLGKVTNSGIIGHQGAICKSITLNIENCYNAGNSKVPVIEKITKNSSTTTITNIKNCYYDKTKSTNSGPVVEGATITAMEPTQMIGNQKFVNTLNNNIGINNWRRWKLVENNYPIFE